MAEPAFTPAQIKEDAQNRVAKTTGQVGGATALTILEQYVAMRTGMLDHSLPTDVFGALVTVQSIAAAWLTNLSKLRA